MNVLVTGAAGRLGSRVARAVHASGHDVLATDLIEPDATPYRFEQADLRDHRRALDVLDGVEAVLHIGNHPGIGSTPRQIVFNENVVMNENIFQGAAERGVAKIVFASTIQLIGSHRDTATVVSDPQRPGYPMDGNTPPDPSNVYALSKAVSETMLRYYATRCGIDGIAIRLPLLHHGDGRALVPSGQENSNDLIEGFTGLTYDDAARLFLAVLEADLPGYRCYLVGTAHRHRDLTFDERASAFYPGLPSGTGDLVDMSAILAETGWRPSVDDHERGNA